MVESLEMPKYLKSSHYPNIREAKAELWINGRKPQKLYFPELSSGVSKDFPKSMKLKEELINKVTNQNLLSDEEFMLNYKKEQISKYKQTLRESPQKIATEILDVRNKVKLLKNAVTNLGRNAIKTDLVDPKIYSANILTNFQTYHVQGEKSPVHKSCTRLPQRHIQVYDCILDSTKIVKPPDMILETYSPLKAKYNHIAN